MQTNTQPIEKPILRGGGAVEVHSIFDTIQGEGPFSGRPAVFVRLAGCNLQCELCDTLYADQRDLMTPQELTDRVADSHTYHRDLVVMTGGEPLRQNLLPAIESLNADGYQVQIETNGTLLPGDLERLWLLPPEHRRQCVTIVCSPKTPRLAQGMWHYIDAVKYVVAAGSADPEDGLPNSSVGPQYGKPARPPQGWQGEVYVQPLDVNEWESNHRNTQQAVKSCLQFGYRLCLQSHKICLLP